MSDDTTSDQDAQELYDPKPAQGRGQYLPFSAILADDDSAHQKDSMGQFIRRDAKVRRDQTNDR
jgi:hypothetical protein